MRLKGASLFGPRERSLRPNFRDYQCCSDQSPRASAQMGRGGGDGKRQFLLLTIMVISRHSCSLASERARFRGKGLKLKLTALSSRQGMKDVCRIREASFVSLPLAYGPRPGCWVLLGGHSRRSWPGQPGELTNSIRAQTTTVPRACNSFRWGLVGTWTETLSGLWPLVRTVGVVVSFCSWRDPWLFPWLFRDTMISFVLHSYPHQQRQDGKEPRGDQTTTSRP